MICDVFLIMAFKLFTEYSIFKKLYSLHLSRQLIVNLCIHFSCCSLETKTYIFHTRYINCAFFKCRSFNINMQICMRVRVFHFHKYNTFGGGAVTLAIIYLLFAAFKQNYSLIYMPCPFRVCAIMTLLHFFSFVALINS